MLYSATYASPLGPIMTASGGDNLVGLWFVGQKYFAPNADAFEEKPELPVLLQTTRWLDRYFAGDSPSIDTLPLAPEGGPFRQTVWKLLRAIPYGQCVTYGDIAKQTAALLGKTRMSSQAIGGAVGHNPIAVIIPCHRVVGTSGSLTGYAGGIDKKVKLLQLEGVDMSRHFVPRKGTAL
jgi:methylated-DNA-[protein]-cysteine S-methyltransferase